MANIYSNDFIFYPYNAKRLFHDSVIRNSEGYRALCQGSILGGVANILLARIETAGSFLLAALSAIVAIATSIVVTPIILSVAILSKMAFRIPGISSDESVQNLTAECDDALIRMLRVNLIIIPVYFLFLSGSAMNVIPGILSEDNIFFSSINWLVEPLGRLKSICAIVNDHRFGLRRFEGTSGKMSLLAGAEECLRALSTENYMEEKSFDDVTYHYTVTQYR